MTNSPNDELAQVRSLNLRYQTLLLLFQELIDRGGDIDPFDRLEFERVHGNTFAFELWGNQALIAFSMQEGDMGVLGKITVSRRRPSGDANAGEHEELLARWFDIHSKVYASPHVADAVGRLGDANFPERFFSTLALALVRID